ncbi:TetR/AcrR family transcriptional regulator [Gordonia sp. DT101]|uniref:TetR/AcrR family transcriptional regulator n=1 Tax=Gordonia sp. DT101 TaxID=3416545 RepID=UPI003CF667BE
MAPRTPSRSATTRTALLVSAESLFLTDGYEQVSVRAICAHAQANPAAVHYHFGSKDRLAVELLEDRMAPHWTDPLDRFDPDRSDVTDLVDEILRPFVDIGEQPVGRLHLQLLDRFVRTHPQATWTQPWFQLDRWSDMLGRLVEGMSDAEARRRWGLAFGLILSQFGGDRAQSRTAVITLRDFVVAGLTSPAPPTTPEENS